MAAWHGDSGSLKNQKQINNYIGGKLNLNYSSASNNCDFNKEFEQFQTSFNQEDGNQTVISKSKITTKDVVIDIEDALLL